MTCGLQGLWEPQSYPGLPGETDDTRKLYYTVVVLNLAI